MSRTTVFLIAVAASGLLAQPAAAGVSAALPQVSTGSSSGSVAPARMRCANCSTDSERRAHTRLLLRIDSLRWEIDNRRMTEAERERVDAELYETVRLLQRSLDQSPTRVEVLTRQGQGPTIEVVRGAPRFPSPTRGFIGVTFEGLSSASLTPTDHRVRFFEYPRVTLVEPSSPAERGGVLQGDTVLAFNGTDVMSEVISFTKLLVPDARIVMRVRRDGGARDIRITVAEQPEYYARRRESAPAVAIGGSRMVPMGGAQRVSEAGPASSTPSAQGPMAVWVDYDGLAGASVERVSAAWAKVLDVDPGTGVFVVSVRPGTPAYRSGLRDADVILRAGGERIGSVTQLRQVLSRGDGNEGVKLVIVRDRKERDVTLRWER